MNMQPHHVVLTSAGDLLGLAVVVVGTLATLFAFGFAFRATVWPGETDPEHPKRVILREDR